MLRKELRTGRRYSRVPYLPTTASVHLLTTLTEHGAGVLACHAHVDLLAAPHVTEEVRGGNVAIAAPGVDVRHCLWVLTEIEQATQNEVVHTFRAVLKQRNVRLEYGEMGEDKRRSYRSVC